MPCKLKQPALLKHWSINIVPRQWIDRHPLGDAAINLGIKADHSVVDALENFKRLDSNFLSSLLEMHGSGLSVLAALRRELPEAALEFFAASQHSRGQLDDLLGALLAD